MLGPAFLAAITAPKTLRLTTSRLQPRQHLEDLLSRAIDLRRHCSQSLGDLLNRCSWGRRSLTSLGHQQPIFAFTNGDTNGISQSNTMTSSHATRAHFYMAVCRCTLNGQHHSEGYGFITPN